MYSTTLKQLPVYSRANYVLLFNFSDIKLRDVPKACIQ